MISSITDNGRQSNTSSSSSSKSESKTPTSLAMDFSGIGSDILKLEEGLRQLHLNQTVSYLEKLEGNESNTDEINFKRLTKLLRQVIYSFPIVSFCLFCEEFFLIISLVSINS